MRQAGRYSDESTRSRTVLTAVAVLLMQVDDRGDALDAFQ